MVYKEDCLYIKMFCFRMKCEFQTEPYKTRSANIKRIKIEGARFKRVAEPALDEPCYYFYYYYYYFYYYYFEECFFRVGYLTFSSNTLRIHRMFTKNIIIKTKFVDKLEIIF